MSALTRPVRSYPLVAFAVLACLFGWLFFIAAALGAAVAPTGNPLGPIIAAALVAACLGREELRAWGRQLATFRCPFRWYALAFAAPIAILVASVLANAAFGAPLPTAAQLAGWTELPLTFVVFLVVIGIGEEAGWTAFAAPRLLGRHPFLMAWVILSAMRIVWHLPLMISGELPLVLGIAGNAAFQFLLLWVFLRSGGVWWLAAIWHATLNTVGSEFLFLMVAGADRARLGVLMSAGYVLLAALIYLVDRRRLAADGLTRLQPAAKLPIAD